MIIIIIIFIQGISISPETVIIYSTGLSAEVHDTMGRNSFRPFPLDCQTFLILLKKNLNREYMESVYYMGIVALQALIHANSYTSLLKFQGTSCFQKP